MTAVDMRPLEEHSQAWTTDDLDAMPETNRKYEIVDGNLIVAPSPASSHQTLGARLWSVLEANCPAEYEVTHDVEIRISNTRSLIPDVQVVTAEAATRGPSKFSPHEVTLAVEIVSPSSVTMDRVTKAALYAEAGIPFYWRVETAHGIVVHTHSLDVTAGAYRPTGEFADTVRVNEPWPIEFPISAITPRFYRPE